MDKNTDFPQYRKLSNNRTFYKIMDERNFWEIQLMGSKKVIHEIKATQYPEMLRIKDMLDLVQPFEPAEKNEFEDLIH